MINFGEVFDAAIKDTVNDVLIKGEIPDIVLSETDNLGEVVEKLMYSTHSHMDVGRCCTRSNNK